MQLKEVTITRVFRGTKETKFGEKATVAIKTVEYGDRWVSTFKVTPDMDSWKEGMKIKLDIEVTDRFINFQMPSESSMLVDRVEKLEKAVFGSKTGTAVKDDIPDIDIDEPDVQPSGLDGFDF